jgi:heat-inducible transcriptional repressor
MLDDRRARILQALVEEYIRTGQPVSSRAILEASQLQVSSATVRNDLAKLESYGFVGQPHTSAGRVPTDQGYRYYVDHCSPARLRSATRARIESFFTDVHRELSKLLQETTGLLSDLSTYPAVVVGPGLGDDKVVGLHLVPLGPTVLLAVTIAESGRVVRDVVRLSSEVSEADLHRAEQVLAKVYHEQTLPAGRERVLAIPKESLADSVRRTVRAVADTLTSAETTTQDIYVGGTSQLAALWEDLAQVHSMLALLERDTIVRQMVNSPGAGTSVRIGAEVNVDGVELAVVSSDYEAGGQGIGRVGVIGPMRMDYRRTIKLVEEVSDGLGESLGSG